MLDPASDAKLRGILVSKGHLLLDVKFLPFVPAPVFQAGLGPACDKSSKPGRGTASTEALLGTPG